MPLPNKEANTVANAIFDKWYCCFGTPLDIVTDQGKEFCEFSPTKRLGTNHLTTLPHHPQCNSQAEVANKTIAKYLASFCDNSTLNWELYLAPLMFSCKTSFHRSIRSSPFFLTFGTEKAKKIWTNSQIWSRFCTCPCPCPWVFRTCQHPNYAKRSMANQLLMTSSAKCFLLER